MTLGGLTLLAAAYGDEAEPTATPAPAGAIEGVIKDADGSPGNQ